MTEPFLIADKLSDLQAPSVEGQPLGESPVQIRSNGGHEVDAQGRWLRALPDNWPAAACRSLLDGAAAVVRIAIAEVLGSAPREPGACMLVSDRGLEGTIGGGNLEWHAVRNALTFLNERRPNPAVRIERLVLAKELAQCCGGVVKLWIERFTRSDLPWLTQAAAAVSQGRPVLLRTELSGDRVTHEIISSTRGASGFVFAAQDDHTARLLEHLHPNPVPLWLYGAGHVGQALVRVLTELPFQITWIDTRAELIPADLPDNVHPLLTDEPVQTLATAPSDASFLVMTHDHGLDYDLCRAILQRNAFAWLGLIGSRSKGARFRSRLAQDGLTPEVIDRLVCPIGITGIVSKQPAAIAVAVAAQLLQRMPEIGASGHQPAMEPCAATECSRCRPRSGEQT